MLDHAPETYSEGCAVALETAIAAFNKAVREAIIDFTSISPQQPTNFNAPLSVCRAVVLYVFRTLVDDPIPFE